MGNGIALTDLVDNSTYGARLAYNTTGSAYGGLTHGVVLTSDENSSLYLSSDLTLGKSNIGETRYGTEWALNTALHGNYDTSGGLFVDANIGVGGAYSRTYTQNKQYALGTAPTLYARPKGEDDVSVSVQNTRQVVEKNTPKTDKVSTVDLSLSTGAAIGFVTGREDRAYAFGNLSHELTNQHNTTGQVGVGYVRQAEIFGDDTLLSFRAGYQHNFNGNTSNNPLTHSGAFVEAGVNIVF